VIAIAFPQLFELLAAYLFIDFLEDIGHGTIPPWSAVASTESTTL
jgi:hypothetical protein